MSRLYTTPCSECGGSGRTERHLGYAARCPCCDGEGSQRFVADRRKHDANTLRILRLAVFTGGTASRYHRGPACSHCEGHGSAVCGLLPCPACRGACVVPLGRRAHRHEPVVVLGPKRTMPPGGWPWCWRSAVIDGRASHLAYHGDGWWLVYGRGGKGPWQTLLGSAAEDGSTTDRAYGGGSRRQRRYRLACLRAVARALREERDDG